MLLPSAYFFQKELSRATASVSCAIIREVPLIRHSEKFNPSIHNEISKAIKRPEKKQSWGIKEKLLDAESGDDGVSGQRRH